MAGFSARPWTPVPGGRRGRSPLVSTRDFGHFGPSKGAIWRHLSTAGERYHWHATCGLFHQADLRRRPPTARKHEYRGQRSKSHCCATSTDIAAKIGSFHLICHLVFISEVKLKLAQAENGFSKLSTTFSIFDLGRSFEPTLIAEFEYAIWLAKSIRYILSFWSTFYLKNWRSYGNFKIWPTFWPSDLVFWPLT